MRILISGASGFIGRGLEPELRREGHDILRLVRTKEGRDCCDYYWDPYEGEIAPEALRGVEAVICLSGENIATRWTQSKKTRILDSRVKTTSFLSKTISHLETPPKVLISASAVGYYGDRGEELLVEDSKYGTGFLAEVVRQWEAATAPAAANGIRVVNLRFGLILSDRPGGVLAKMLTPFKIGAGGAIGDGNQYWSWVAMDDVAGVFKFALAHDNLEGAVNVASPNPVTNQEFTRLLGKVLNRPTVLTLPSVALRLALGEMADSTLLASARIEPRKLKQAGYTFQQPELEPLLQKLIHGQGEA